MVAGHVALGERHVAEQRARIEWLECAGLDASRARSLLALLEDCQRLHVEHRDRLERELSRCLAVLKPSAAPPT
jgi:hypothetical protein